MKLRAEIVPYSSVVGGSLTLLDERGAAQFMVMFCGTSWGISKEQSAALCARVGQLVNEHGLDVPPHD
jgi:hypothetical protein